MNVLSEAERKSEEARESVRSGDCLIDLVIRNLTFRHPLPINLSSSSEKGERRNKDIRYQLDNGKKAPSRARAYCVKVASSGHSLDISVKEYMVIPR